MLRRRLGLTALLVCLLFACSSVCPNFDFCEKCEGSGKHNPEHAFIKIKEAEKRGAPGAGGAGAGPWGGGRWAHGPHGGPHGGHHGRGRGMWRMFGGGRGHSPGRHGGGEGGSWRRRDQSPAGSSVPDGEKLKATFVKDLSLPDRTELAAQQTLVKTWSVRNTGSAAWPADCKLIFVRGDRDLSAQEEFPVAAGMLCFRPACRRVR
jgi:hypothetical protein